MRCQILREYFPPLLILVALTTHRAVADVHIMPSLELCVAGSELVARASVVVETGPNLLRVRVTEAIKGQPPATFDLTYPGGTGTDLTLRRSRDPGALGPRPPQVGHDILLFARVIPYDPPEVRATWEPVLLDGSDFVIALGLRPLTYADEILPAARAAAPFPKADWGPSLVIDARLPLDANSWSQESSRLWVRFPRDARAEEHLYRIIAFDPSPELRHEAIGQLYWFRSPRADATLRSLLADKTVLVEQYGRYTLKPAKWLRQRYDLRFAAAEALTLDDTPPAHAFPTVAFEGPTLAYRPIRRPLLCLSLVLAIPLAWLLLHYVLARRRRTHVRIARPLATPLTLACLAIVISAITLRIRSRSLDLVLIRNDSLHSISLRRGHLHYSRVTEWLPPANQPHDSDDWMYARGIVFGQFDSTAFDEGDEYVSRVTNLIRLGFSHSTARVMNPFDYRQTLPYRSLSVPLYLPIALLLVLPFFQLKRTLTRLHRRRRGLCPACAYDLQATPTRCPECGHVPNPPDTKHILDNSVPNP